MINANELRTHSYKEIVESILEKIESAIVSCNNNNEKQLSYWVERNGWFTCDLGVEEISWGDVIQEIIKELEKYGFTCRLYDSYGTVSYTKVFKITW